MKHSTKVRPLQSGKVEIEMESWSQENRISEKKSLLRKALIPMTLTMEAFGLHFPGKNNSRKKIYCNFLRIYCTVIWILLWLNFARMFTIFKPGDTIATGLFMKCGSVIYTAISAVANTSCHRLSASGIVEELFDRASNEMDCRIKCIRVKAIAAAGLAWFSAIFVTGASGYFLLDQPQCFLMALAPLGTLIPDADGLVINIATAIFFVVSLYQTAAIICPLMWNFLWASILRDEFNRCNSKLREVGKMPAKYLTNQIMEDLRRRHQTLCRIVERYDRYICLANATKLVGLIAVVILNLYSFFWIPSSTNNVIAMGLMFTWIVLSLTALFALVFTGIMVNHAVRF